MSARNVYPLPEGDDKALEHTNTSGAYVSGLLAILTLVALYILFCGVSVDR
jgi:hypothetical protein